MNTKIKTFFIIMFSIIVLRVQAQTIENALKGPVQQLYRAKTMYSMMQASSNLDNLTRRWPNEFMANYYSAYSKVVISYAVKDPKRRDMFLDQADKYYQRAKQINPETDEVYVLGASIANARMAVNKSRWMLYSGAFNKDLAKAKALNPNNPRIYYLKGVSVFYTPKMFGGGAEKAKLYFEKAKTLFETQDTSSVMKPTWGARQNESFLKRCGK